MAYSDSFPAIRPSFQFSADAGRLDSRITFSRSDTPPTYAAPSAVHYWSNEKHLSSENLLPYSTPNTAWGYGNFTPTYSQTGPYTGANATLYTEVATTATFFAYGADFAHKAGTSYTYSVWAKVASGTRTHIQIRPSGLGNGKFYATYNLSGAGSVTQTGGSYYVSSSITAGPTGWYKLVLNVNALVDDAANSLMIMSAEATGGEAQTLTGDTGNSFLIFGAQVSTTGETVLNETSGQIHRSYASTLKSVSTAGQPRFEYSPTDSASEAIGQSRGLLIEGSSTNLVSFSESFSNQTVNDCTLTEGAAVGPDATLSANLLVPTTTANLLRNVNLDDGNSFSHTSGNNYAYSIFAKAAGYNYVQWVGLGYFGYTYCNFDLSSGTVGNKSGSVTGSVESVGNGWYRLTVVAPATVTNSSASKGVWAVVTSSTAARNEQFTGDGYSGVLLTMAQCELSSFASSYIKSNSGSATTRAADSAAMVNSSLFDNGEGALFVEADQLVANTYNGIASLETDISNIVHIFGNTTNFRAEVVNGGSTVANMTASGNSPQGVARKHCLTYSPTETKYFVGGSQIGSTDTSLSVPQTSTLRIGGFNTGTGYALNGHVKRVAVYGQSLSSTELAALTSS